MLLLLILKGCGANDIEKMEQHASNRNIEVCFTSLVGVMGINKGWGFLIKCCIHPKSLCSPSPFLCKRKKLRRETTLGHCQGICQELEEWRGHTPSWPLLTWPSARSLQWPWWSEGRAWADEHTMWNNVAQRPLPPLSPMDTDAHSHLVPTEEKTRDAWKQWPVGLWNVCALREDCRLEQRERGGPFARWGCIMEKDCWYCFCC